MTVPALDTSFIGTFAYIQPATSIQLADALPYFLTYVQYPEYVDGVIRIWDTGSESPPNPNNYCDVYIRIRTDGWMMAFIPDDAHQGLACWSPYDWILGNYENRADLLWWGHTSSSSAVPTTNATRLGRALSELWTHLKDNSDNPTYVFSYADVGYYDYEIITSTKIYVFGQTYNVGTNQSVHRYYYFTVPIGTNIQAACTNFGYKISSPDTIYDVTGYMIINEGTAKEHTFFSFVEIRNIEHVTNGYLGEDTLAHIYDGGVQNKMHTYHMKHGAGTVCINSALVIFADG